MNTIRSADPLGSIDSTELRILHALAITGSLTATAAQLGLSQPAVSQRIKRVETRLAVPLIAVSYTHLDVYKRQTSGRTRSHGVTGGVYKTRERIHRDMLLRDY